MNDRIVNRLQPFPLILLAFSLPLSISLSQTFYSLAFLLFIIKMVSQRRKSLRRTGLEIPIIVLAVVYIFAVLSSSFPLESIRILRKLILFGLFFIVADSLKSEIEKSRLLNVWFLGVIIASVWTVIEYFRGVVRPGGFFWYMTFGHFAAIFLGVSIPLIGLKNYKRTSILAVSVFVIGAIALLLTRTRGAWIGFIAGLVLFLIIRRRWVFLASFVVGLALIVSILFVCFPNSGAGKEITSLLRPLDKQAPRVAESNLKRWHMCKASWRMFKKHPVLGVGPYRFRKELPNYLPEQVKTEIFKHELYDEAHNIYLDYLATMGTIGLVSLLFFLFTVFRLLVLKYKIHKPGFEKNLVLGVLIAFTGFCVAGLFSQSFHDSEILLNLCFLLGLVL